MSAAMVETIFRVKCRDDKIVNVPLSLAKHSVTWTRMLDGLRDNLANFGGDDLAAVPIKLQFTEAALIKVLEWAALHKDEDLWEKDPTATNEELLALLTKEDKELLNADVGILIEMAELTNYLAIPLLEVFLFLTLAGMMKGKTPAEIRMTFGIGQAETEAEAEEVRKRNEWVNPNRKKEPQPQLVQGPVEDEDEIQIVHDNRNPI